MENWKITQLENLIKKYATSYYSGEAEVSDEYFDSLVDQLKEIDPNNELLRTPGWGYKPSVYKNKYKHWYGLTIGSLDKVKEGETLPKINKNVESLRVSAKLDGLSVVSYFENGFLIQALTRGDGTTGIDVTSKVLKILRADNKFNEPLYTDDRLFTGAIRGEVIMPQKIWDSEKYASLREENPSANPRNYASGVLNRDKDSDELKDLRYVVYKVLVSKDYNFNDIENVTTFLNDNFNYVAPYVYVDPYEEDQDYVSPSSLKNLVTIFKEEYPCDGLVFSTLSNEINPNLKWNEFAYKFEPESKEVIVKKVTYNVTRTGRMAPLIWFDPVELSDAIVQKCTGFNAEFIKTNGIGPGSKILVQRANEVIPYIVKVLETTEADLPKVCPNCGTELIWKGVDLICPNENDSQLAYHFISTIAPIEGAGYSLYNGIVQSLSLNNLTSLVQFMNDLRFHGVYYIMGTSIKQNFSGEVTLKKVEAILDKLCKPIDAVTFIAACNINGVSYTTAKSIMDNYPEFIEDLCDNKLNELTILNINGIGEAVLQSIRNFKDRIKMLASVVDLQEYKKEDPKEIKFKVAITGALSMKRADFDAELQKRGIEQSGNFKELRYLITNNPGSTSSKMQKAKELGIEVISEEEFVKKYFD